MERLKRPLLYLFIYQLLVHVNKKPTLLKDCITAPYLQDKSWFGNISFFWLWLVCRLIIVKKEDKDLYKIHMQKGTMKMWSCKVFYFSTIRMYSRIVMSRPFYTFYDMNMSLRAELQALGSGNPCLELRRKTISCAHYCKSSDNSVTRKGSVLINLGWNGWGVYLPPGPNHVPPRNKMSRAYVYKCGVIRELLGRRSNVL